MEYPNRIRAIREAKDWSIEKLAEKVGLSVSYVSRLEKGGRNLAVANLEKFAKAFGVKDTELLPGSDDEAPPPEPDDRTDVRPVGKMVSLVGYVGAGSQAHFYAVAQENLDEVAAPDDWTKDTVAVEIRGDSLGSFFDRWIVYYDDVRSPVTSDLYNKLCIVGLADDRVLIKKIRGRADGLYDLLSVREDPIEGVAVEWAAKVKSMRPR